MTIGATYSYKPSLIAKADTFDLTPDALSWHARGRSGLWRYADIVAVRLSYRPVSMQARRFRADITHRNGASLPIVSASWQTASLMTTQDDGYRALITALHARMADAGSGAMLSGGWRRWMFRLVTGLTSIVSMMLFGLLFRALWLGEWPGALFLIGFGAVFAWQIGSFIRRNTPRRYTFDALPQNLLP